MSDFDDYPIVDRFKQFMITLRSCNLSNPSLDDKIDELKNQVTYFFEIFSDTEIENALNNDLSSFFTKIEIFIDSFQKDARYIYSIRTGSPGRKEIISTYRNDLLNFITILSDFTLSQYNILQKIKKMITKKIDKSKIQRVINQFFLEISIFNFSNNIQTFDNPPYYQITNIPSYKHIHDQINSTQKKFINVVGPNGSGKTKLIPLFLASRSLGFSISSRFIILIENDIESIPEIEKTYKKINTNNDFFKKGQSPLIITSSLHSFCEHSKDEEKKPVIIAILTPIEALKLIHKEYKITYNDVTFLINTTFIIDDVNDRKVETDVLMQDIYENIYNRSLLDEVAKLVIIGTFSDKRFLTMFGRHCETFEIPIETEDVTVKEIKCNNYLEIGKISIFKEMTKFFDSWMEEKKIDVGSVITFVPNVKTGLSIYKNLNKKYQDNPLNNVILLQTKIMRGENLESFYRRLLNDIENEINTKMIKEEDISTKIIFVYPLNLTGNFHEEEKVFVNSNLPLPFIEKNFVRLIITTNKNEHLLKVPDATVIFDSGLTEVEYYISTKFVSSFKLEELPVSTINQRNILLNGQKKSAHFIFELANEKGKKETPPSVQRCNLDQSILLLRKIDIKFEDQRNLPNEPLGKNVRSSIRKLKKIGFIDENGKLTEVGSQTSVFSNVSPNLALATTKYEKNHEFAFLVSLIIEKSSDLIEKSQTPLLCDHFCTESDVVTILESIFALNESEEEDKNEKSGFSLNTLESIYIMMANTFEKESKEEGEQMAIDSIKWARRQKGGLLKMVDDFVDLLNQEDNYIELRKASFLYMTGVGAGSDPTIVYKGNDKLTFDKGTEALIKFSKRPGWIGLQAPGNIYVLSFQVEEAVKINRGFLLHYDKTFEEDEDKNIGIISSKVEPFLNSCFFIALFEAYWDKNDVEKKLIPIYHSFKPKKETAFLIHINESNKNTFINYCPKNLKVQNEMSKIIPLLASLIPFVPRSIVAKCDVPICAVELLSYGAASHYDTHVFLIDKPELPKPLAYPLNKNSLNFASENLKDLSKTHPKIRFAITGESIYYKFIKERQIETDFSYPNVDPTIQTVFDPMKSSHLVLLVDEDYGGRPTKTDAIPWIVNNKNKKRKKKSKDSKKLNLLIDVASKIMSKIGTVERSNDLFFITIDKGFPTVDDGEIPVELQNQVGFKDGQITGGIHQLYYQLEKNYVKNDGLEDNIPIKSLGSTNHCKRYKSEASKQQLIDQINDQLTSKFGYKGMSVDTIFIGNSMICINVSDLPPEITSHQPPENMYDYSYKPCEADNIINEVLNGLSVPVSTITHEPTSRIVVKQFRRFQITEDEFVNYVEKICNEFGFLCISEPNYIKGGHDIKSDLEGVVGEMIINLIGKTSCISFASLISKKFNGIDSSVGITITMTMNAMSTMKSLNSLNPRLGAIPKISPLNNVVRVPKCEIEAMKDLVKTHNNWKFNEEYRILIFPYNDSEEAKQRLLHVREEDNICCFFACGTDEPELLPQCVYANEKDGSVKPFGICKNCAISLIQNFEDIQAIYNPVTHLLDQENLADIKKPLPGLNLFEENEDKKGNIWPQIPIGQIIWAFMSDRNLALYVKAWFTIMIEFCIQTCGLFIYCPNHPKFPILRPKKNETVKCTVCDMIYCKDCDSWHLMGQQCFEGLPGVKRCPNCHCPGEKYTGCDHITCPRCGTNWNYGTGARM